MSFSEAEARIRRLMARMSDDELRLSVVQDRILRTRQDIAGFYQVGAGRGCTTTITGRIIGGSHTPLPLANTTIQVTGHTSGIDYGTFLSTDGYYSISIEIDSSDTLLDFAVTGPGPRFAAGVNVVGFLRCDSVTLTDIKATAAAGYHFTVSSNGQACHYPIADTLYWAQAYLGSGVVTWNGTNWSYACGELGYVPRPETPCAGSGTTVMNIQLQEGGSGFVAQTWIPTVAVGSSCSRAMTCPWDLSGSRVQAVGWPLVPPATTCPTDTDSFSVTFTGGALPRFAGSGAPLLQLDIPINDFEITFSEDPL